MRSKSLAWIDSLKAKELQNLATAIGVASSGTKAALAERITGNLALYQKKARTSTRSTAGLKKDIGNGDGGAKPLSLLSIDMGIRNLAFAHIVKERRVKKGGGLFKASAVPVLAAWNRLDVSLFDNEDGKAIDGIDSIWRPSTSQIATTAKRKSGRKNKKKKKKKKKDDDDDDETTTSDKELDDEQVQLQPCAEKESFAPETYARHAYSLVNSLITKYNPTHIIIERQRFRSGGGSVVQEWTIRVGMFEAMLYAVIHTLRRERGENAVDFYLEGVNPKRVARYWVGRNPWALEKSERSRKTATAKATKQAKINVLLEWLSAKNGGKKLRLGENELARAIATSYIGKCTRRARRAKKTTKAIAIANEEAEQDQEQIRMTAPSPSQPAEEMIELDKLDDLADCVLQGVAWLEWERLREELAAKEPSEREIAELVSA